MPITSPGNDDDTGENHQPTLRKNTAEPVEQTLKQNTQGRHIGSRLLADAERRIAQAGGTMAAVHSENDHYKFYEQRGYRLTDEVYEGGRHGWLVKDLILGSEN